MKLRSRLLLLAALAGFAAPVFPAGPADKPNFLFLFADDQRADTISAWGNPNIRTPNLDRLVREGYSFRQNYCFGSNSGAVCVPSRAMLMTGRTWFHVDHRMTGATLLPELLRRHGYTTFATGKWHNQSPSFLRGFERGKSVFFGGMNDHTQTKVQDVSPTGTLVNERVADKFSTEEFADAAIDFLREYREPSPFFAYVAFTAPHDPRNPPEPYREMYYRQRPPLPKNFRPEHPFDNGFVVGRDENLGGWPRTETMISDQLAEYYGLITHLDEQVGRILEALAQTGRAKNTFVIYAADHGLALGSHGLLGKQSLYEHSMRCPLIVAGPGVPAGGASTAFTYLHDLYPTLCTLAGLQHPANLEGHDLRPLWLGEKARVRDSVFLAFSDLMRSVRDDRWKLICYPQINHRQLFDLRTDPDELQDLSQHPEHAARVEQLLELMSTWQRNLGDTQPLTVAEPKPKAVELTGRPRKPDQWQPQWIVEKYF